MFSYKSTREQLLEERRKNAALTAQLAQTNANLEFIAMMTDVSIDDEDAPEMEVDGNE